MGASLKIPSSLDRRAALMGLGIVAALLLGAALAFTYFMYLRPLLQSRAAQAWAQVPCRILQNNLVTHQGSKGGVSYDLDVNYTYTFAGRQYASSAYDFTVGSTNNYNWWAAGASRFPAGRPALCYVDPQNPATAVLVGDFDRNPVIWVFTAMFGVPGFIMAGVVAHHALRRLKFGESVLELANAPVALGGQLTGNIALSRPVQPAEGFALRLACIHRVVTGSGRSRRVLESALWQEDKQVEPNLNDSIPVLFNLPVDGTATDGLNINDRTFWRLRANAKMPGVDYAAEFEVPVVPAPRGAAPSPYALGQPFSATEDFTHYQQPAHSRIRVQDTTGGREFYFPAFRNRGAAVFLLFFAIMWTAITVFLINSSAPKLFSLVFVAFDVPMVFWMLHEWFATTRVVAERGKITLIKHFCGVRRTRELAASDISQINIVHGETYNNVVLFNIQIILNNGGKVTAGDEIPDAHEAHWLALEMARCAGVGS